MVINELVSEHKSRRPRQSPNGCRCVSFDGFARCRPDGGCRHPLVTECYEHGFRIGDLERPAVRNIGVCVLTLGSSILRLVRATSKRQAFRIVRMANFEPAHTKSLWFMSVRMRDCYLDVKASPWRRRTFQVRTQVDEDGAFGGAVLIRSITTNILPDGGIEIANGHLRNASRTSRFANECIDKDGCVVLWLDVRREGGGGVVNRRAVEVHRLDLWDGDKNFKVRRRIGRWQEKQTDKVILKPNTLMEVQPLNAMDGSLERIFNHPKSCCSSIRYAWVRNIVLRQLPGYRI